MSATPGGLGNNLWATSFSPTDLSVNSLFSGLNELDGLTYSIAGAPLPSMCSSNPFWSGLYKEFQQQQVFTDALWKALSSNPAPKQAPAKKA